MRKRTIKGNHSPLLNKRTMASEGKLSFRKVANINMKARQHDRLY